MCVCVSGPCGSGGLKTDTGVTQCADAPEAHSSAPVGLKREKKKNYTHEARSPPIAGLTQHSGLPHPE